MNSSSGSDDTVVYIYDLTPTLTMAPADAYETVQLVAALGGIVNRNGPRLYQMYTSVDPMWLEYCRKHWLTNITLVNITGGIPALVHMFADDINGVVLYDPKVASTSNVANTAAGVLDVLPVCYRPMPGSLYTQLVASGPKLQVQETLVGRFNGSVTGSAKCDAYQWAIAQYITSGKVNPAIHAYYIDYFWVDAAPQHKGSSYTVNTISNIDYAISQRGFFWDLDAWGDAPPNDDPHQPVGTDQHTLINILAASYHALNGQSMISVDGFTPWLFKYVAPYSKHQGVATEWQTSKLLSAFNAYVSADACCVDGMANAAFFAHFPLQERYVQNPAPTPQQLEALGFYNTTTGKVAPFTYFSFYVGDYDSASWLYNEFDAKWNDTARGTVPLGWAVDPNLSARFPPIFDLIFRTKTPADRLTTGDSGAGYLNPTQLFPPRQYSNLPSAADTWVEHCTPLYRKFDVSFTGFIINGAAGTMTEEAQNMYTAFSWDGMTDQTGYPPSGKGNPYLANGTTPVFQEWDLPGGNATAAAGVITSRAPKPDNEPHFQVYRTVLQTAAYHADIVQDLKKNPAMAAQLRVVEPLVLGYLARIALGGNNNDRVTYVDDSVPRSIAASQSMDGVTFVVRNNGWNDLHVGPLPSPSTPAPVVVLRFGFVAPGSVTPDMLALRAVATPASVAPGASATFTALGGQTAPPGLRVGDKVDLVYGLWREAGDGTATAFNARGNPLYRISLTVAASEVL